MSKHEQYDYNKLGNLFSDTNEEGVELYDWDWFWVNERVTTELMHNGFTPWEFPTKVICVLVVKVVLDYIREKEQDE